MFFGFIALVVSIIVAVKVSGLAREVRELKAGTVKNTVPTQGALIQNGASVQPVSQQSTHTPVQPTVAVAPTVSTEPDYLEQFVHWLTENWLLKIGVILILIGFGWFMSYAFVHNWIGPVGRVLLGFIIGGGLAAFGTFRMNSHTVQGTVFLILGSAIAVITSFAAQVVYDFFPPAIALMIPVLVALYVTFVALTYNRQAIAIYAVLIGFIAPLLTNSSEANYTFLFAYLALVSIGSIWIAVIKNWRVITAVSVVGIFIYTLGYLAQSYGISFETHFAVVLMLYGLAALYFVVSMLSIVNSDKDVNISDIVVAIVTSILVISVTLAKIPFEIISIVLALWIVPFALGGFYVFFKTQKERFFYMYACVAIVFLAVATAAELSGPALVIAYAFESACISIVSYIVTNRLKIGYATSTLMFVPGFLALNSFASRAWNQGVFHSDFAVIALVTALFFVLGVFYYFMSKQQTEELAQVYAVHLVIGSLFAFGLIWTALQAGLGDSGVAVLYALTIYTIVGLITYFRGVFTENTGLRYYGAVVLLLVIAVGNISGVFSSNV